MGRTSLGSTEGYEVASTTEAILRRTPAVLEALLAGLPDSCLDAREGMGAWNAREVASHMADLERDAWLPRVVTILEHGRTKTLGGVDRERFRVRYANMTIEVVLGEFRGLRADNVRALHDLRLDGVDLDRSGLHPVFGEVRLAELLGAWVVHDLTHLAQISRALASPYGRAVGPWRDLLPILQPRAQRPWYGAPPFRGHANGGHGWPESS